MIACARSWCDSRCVARLVPIFAAGRQRIACVPLLRQVAGHHSSIPRTGDHVVGDTLEFIQYAIGEHLVGLVLALDDQLTAPTDSIELRAKSTSRVADDPWTVAAEAGPQIFGRLDDVEDETERFVRGLVELWRGKRERAQTTLATVTLPRAQRWQQLLGITADARTPLAVKKGASELLATAVRRRDAKKCIAALVAVAQQESTIDADTLGDALGFALDEPPSAIAPLRPLLAAASARCEGAHRDEVASYQLACLAARLGERDHMLAWLRATLAAGSKPSEPPADKDFRAYWNDPEFRALCPASLVPWREVMIWNTRTGERVEDEQARGKLMKSFRDRGKIRGHVLVDPGVYDLEDVDYVERNSPAPEQIDFAGLP